MKRQVDDRRYGRSSCGQRNGLRAPRLGQLRRRDGDDRRKRRDGARMAESARPPRRESLRRILGRRPRAAFPHGIARPRSGDDQGRERASGWSAIRRRRCRGRCGRSASSSTARPSNCADDGGLSRVARGAGAIRLGPRGAPFGAPLHARKPRARARRRAPCRRHRDLRRRAGAAPPRRGGGDRTGRRCRSRRRVSRCRCRRVSCSSRRRRGRSGSIRPSSSRWRSWRSALLNVAYFHARFGGALRAGRCAGARRAFRPRSPSSPG